MAGSWLYCISAAVGRNFDLNDATLPANVPNFRSLINNGRIVEDPIWHISQRGDDVRAGDELYIYTGDDGLGVIGYATVKQIKKQAKGWDLYPEFDLEKSRALLLEPVAASLVRAWGLHLRKNVIDISSFVTYLHPHLPWVSAKRESPRTDEFAEPEDIEGTKTEALRFSTKRSRRLRNLAFKSAKGICCVCERNFSKLLAGRGLRVLQVHHRDQLSARNCPSVTKVSDLAVVCANCHLLLHYDPKKAMSVEKLKSMFQESEDKA
jgi:hypothetical protein